MSSLTRAHSRKRPALVMTTCSNFQGGRLRKRRLLLNCVLLPVTPLIDIIRNVRSVKINSELVPAVSITDFRQFFALRFMVFFLKTLLTGHLPYTAWRFQFPTVISRRWPISGDAPTIFALFNSTED